MHYASLLLLFLFSVESALGWSSAGHMVIAAEAYRELPTRFKKRAIELLKSHPDYEKWEKAFAAGPGNLDLDTYVFLRSSTWPDEIRRHGSEYDHPRWHYINYPLEGPAFAFLPGPIPDDDILYGINRCEKILSDKNTTAEERAAHLSYLIHLIGDLHQPLHCATWISASYPAPEGDKGGNDFYIKPAHEPIRLHSFWDQLLGRS